MNHHKGVQLTLTFTQRAGVLIQGDKRLRSHLTLLTGVGATDEKQYLQLAAVAVGQPSGY